MKNEDVADCNSLPDGLVNGDAVTGVNVCSGAIAHANVRLERLLHTAERNRSRGNRPSGRCGVDESHSHRLKASLLAAWGGAANAILCLVTRGRHHLPPMYRSRSGHSKRSIAELVENTRALAQAQIQIDIIK
jgi:hypothetical protein